MSPIVIDVDGSGFRISDASGGVLFDFYGIRKMLLSGRNYIRYLISMSHQSRLISKSQGEPTDTEISFATERRLQTAKAFKLDAGLGTYFF
jgi:hypothetical protein